MEENRRTSRTFTRKGRGNKMEELAKNEQKLKEDDELGIFKEVSSDEDFNPEAEDFEESSSSKISGGEIEEDDEEDKEEEEKEDEISSIKKKKKKKEESEILDIEQLDIDKIDMMEELKDKIILLLAFYVSLIYAIYSNMWRV